jgi:hypothetical protein
MEKKNPTRQIRKSVIREYKNIITITRMIQLNYFETNGISKVVACYLNFSWYQLTRLLIPKDEVV